MSQTIRQLAGSLGVSERLIIDAIAQLGIQPEGFDGNNLYPDDSAGRIYFNLGLDKRKPKNQLAYLLGITARPDFVRQDPWP